MGTKAENEDEHKRPSYWTILYLRVPAKAIIVSDHIPTNQLIIMDH